jgi:hypothetical protein
MMLTVSVLMASITFSASHATPKKQCVSAQSNLCLVGTFEQCPDALVHGKQECHDTDHLHSLVALRLVRENDPTDSPYTVLCFLHLQLGQRKRTHGGVNQQMIREQELMGLALNEV